MKKETGLTVKGKTDTSVALAVKFNKENLAPALSKVERHLVLSSNGVKIMDMDPKDVAKGINSALITAYKVLGHRTALADKKGFATTVVLIANNVCNKYYGYTINDIQDAISEGAHGEYTLDNEKTFIAPESVNRWIKKHIARKNQAIKKQFEYESATKSHAGNKLEPQDEKQVMILWVLNSFEKVKAKKEYYDMGNSAYDFLHSLNIIPYTKERKLEILNQAREQLIKHENAVICLNTQERENKHARIEQIQKEPITKNEIVISEAKRITLMTFYNELIEMGQELKDLLEPHIVIKPETPTSK